MSYPIKLSSTEAPLLFFMTLSSDHITGATGLSPTVTISKSGGAFASPSGAVSEIANGWYKVAANATDTGTLGPIALHATAATADPCDLIAAAIVAYDPQDAQRLGLASIPNANPAANGGLPTVDANNNLHGLQVGIGTGQLNTSGGKVPSTLAAADVSGNVPADAKAINAVSTSSVTSVSAFIGSTGAAINGTNANTLSSHDPGATLGTSTLTQAQVSGGAYALNSASFAFNAAFDFTSTQKTSIGTAVAASAVASVTGNVGGNVAGSVASVANQSATTGDAFARIGLAGVGLTNLGDTRIAHLDADISSRSTYAGADTAGTTTLLGRITAAVALAGSAPSWYSAPVDVSANVSAIKVKTDNLPASPAAVGSSMTLTTGERTSIADAMLDETDGIETGLTPRQTLRAMVSALAGVLAGAGTAGITIKGAGVATTRITATVDAAGNRSVIVLNL